MNGIVTVSAGQYEISAAVWLDIRSTDIGTAISVCDSRVNRRYTVCIDNGQTTRAEVAKLIRDVPDPIPGDGAALPQPVVRSRHSAVDNGFLAGACRSSLPNTRHRFTVRYVVGDKCDDIPLMLLGGYACDQHIMLLFRYTEGTKTRDGVMEVMRDGLVQPAPDDLRLRLELGDWHRFRQLKAGQRFKLGDLCWRKLGFTDLRRIAVGRHFRSDHPTWRTDPAEVARFNARFRRARKANPLARFKSSSVKFTIRHGREYRPRNRCFVMAGYTDGTTVFVLFRIRNGYDALGRIVEPDQMIIKDDRDCHRLPEQEWPHLMEMKVGETFTAGGKQWTKLSAERTASIVGGKVFRKLTRPPSSPPGNCAGSIPMMGRSTDMERMINSEEPDQFHARIVTLMECAPGDDHTHNRPATLITFAFQGEIEQPILLSLKDTEKLLVGLLGSLAEHGNEKAEEIRDRYFDT